VLCLTQHKLFGFLEKVLTVLEGQQKQGYIVGGFVRDWLLARETNDIDITVDGDSIEIARQVAEATGGKFVVLDEANGVARVVVQAAANEACGETEVHLDFSLLSGNIESDLARRDFSINAMAIELRDFVLQRRQIAETKRPAMAPAASVFPFRIIDPFSGLVDLRAKTVRCLNNKVFEADASRLLRAVRLAAELNLNIEPQTESLIKSYAHIITQVPGERTREELLRLLHLPRAAFHLRYLDRLGLLTSLIPELKESKGIEQPTLHFWDVFEHSLQTVAAIEFLTREGEWEYGNKEMLEIAPWSQRIEAHLSQKVSGTSNRRVLLKVAGLFHDIAKPRTKSLDDSGRARFLGHAKEGARMTREILERLRFSNREMDLVEDLVYHHLRPMQMAHEGLPTQRAVYRYFRDTGDAGIDILFLALADCLASRGPLLSMDEWKWRCQSVSFVLEEHERQRSKVLPRKLIDGHDLISTFGLEPGPLIGELLNIVKEAQASGDVTTREEALNLVRRELSRRAKQLSPEVN